MATMTKNLTENEQAELERLPNNFESLFDGTLCEWTGDFHHIELKEGAMPCHARPFSVLGAHENALRGKVECLCKTRVPEKVNHSKWRVPTTIFPKKD